jgi:hypothetical protein
VFESLCKKNKDRYARCDYLSERRRATLFESWLGLCGQHSWQRFYGCLFAATLSLNSSPQTTIASVLAAAAEAKTIGYAQHGMGGLSACVGEGCAMQLDGLLGRHRRNDFNVADPLGLISHS